MPLRIAEIRTVEIACLASARKTGEQMDSSISCRGRAVYRSAMRASQR